MKKKLIIVRHGNTFRKGETPTRVGAKTDLPLVEEERGRSVGKYLLANDIIPSKVYAAPLKRTTETAKLAMEELGIKSAELKLSDDFVEIDYGPDENKTEDVVIERIGQPAIDLWNKKAIAPEGWVVDVDKIITAWQSFADNIADGETAMLVSSNGIIRFAPHILDEDYDNFCNNHDIKVATGGVCIFEYENNRWTCKEWNAKPYKLFNN
jgi:Fructose-2,6-bisphosphatase